MKDNCNYEEMKLLKEIKMDVIQNFNIPEKRLDDKWNKIFRKNEIVGQGWIGIGLKTDLYEDEKWIGNNDEEGEWHFAYYVPKEFRYSKNREIKAFLGNIIIDGFKIGPLQLLKNYSDENHPGNKVGVGIYFSTDIHLARGYSEIMNINGINYYSIIMVRVKPDKIRDAKCDLPYWVLNPSTDEIRPYRILFKKAD